MGDDGFRDAAFIGSVALATASVVLLVGRKGRVAIATDRRAVSSGGRRLVCRRLSGGLGSDKTADVDEIVGDDTESDPALHANVATVTATLETMPTLADADASLASGTPSLAVAEPTLLLLMLAAGTLGAMVGNADALDITAAEFGGAAAISTTS